ncbi:hypothetical protein IAT40_005186 [Kwoniella sp. CBS 6097]
MPVIPFLKSDREKERDRDRSKDDNSPGPNPIPGASMSNSGPLPSPQPSFNNPFSSSTASTTNDSPNSTPSKYHPSRLLRRKASLSAKNANGEKDKESDVEPLPTGSSMNSNLNSDSGPISPRALPSSPRRLPSSPRGLPASPRTFFGFEASDKDKERDKYHTFPRRGSDVRRGSLGGSVINGLPSPTASKRSAYVYNGRLTTEGTADEDVVIIPSARSVEDHDQDLSSDLAALGLRSTSTSSTPKTPPVTLSSSVPKVVDGGFGMEHASGFVFGSGSGYNSFGQAHEYSGNGVNEHTGFSGKIAKDQDALVDTRFTHNRPLTPPDSASYLHSTHPFYPTALSPPRRPLPKSPRAKANLRQRESSSPGLGVTPPSVGMMQATSAVGGSSSCVSPRQPSPPHSTERPAQRNTSSSTFETSSKRSRPAVTAEWLARKPSSASSSPSNLKHRPSLSVDHQHSQSSLRSSPSTAESDFPKRTESPNSLMHPSTPKRQGSLDASPDINACFSGTSMTMHSRAKPRSTSFSSTNSDTDLDPPSSDGEIGVNSRRRSLLTTPSNSRSAKNPSPSAALSNYGGYEVEILCNDGRAGNISNDDSSVSVNRTGGGGEDEIRWEVIIRRQSSRSTIQATSSPLQLSTTSSTATAPLSASSINLSLSLDQPTGKLVFISFPMDIHATPTRRRRPSMSAAHAKSGPSSLLANGNLQQIPSPRASHPARPSTPPLQTRSNLSSLNARDTPTRTPSSRRKAPPAWPSPKTKIDQPSPSAATAGDADQSPRDVFTPRKSRVTPSRLDGDLLNKVTNAD